MDKIKPKALNRFLQVKYKSFFDYIFHAGIHPMDLLIIFLTFLFTGMNLTVYLEKKIYYLAIGFVIFYRLLFYFVSYDKSKLLIDDFGVKTLEKFLGFSLFIDYDQITSFSIENEKKLVINYYSRLFKRKKKYSINYLSKKQIMEAKEILDLNLSFRKENKTI